ncbi:HD-GYP domain-containing protein [Anaerobranca gottschalkii]|uniref:HDIG domain-containing protein n=1 Tax=Anaerobranca gottschalkii DSM 13577 TaxID=1120990 RepID=A0A1I0BWP5_9FIRM|nr:HD-GYP domain-containing protein [Anaerobranca gottschalkii]SET11400.1 HDIG domain-containing protein [Anaerobranca gottschalkii DSM 13577]
MKNNYKLPLYLAFIYSLFALTFGYAYFRYPFDIDVITLLFFCFLAAVTESMAIVYKKLAFSPGFIITTASIILFGTLPAMVIVFAGMIFRVVRHQNKYYHFLNVPIYKSFFNGSVVGISVFTAAEVYRYTSILPLAPIANITFGLVAVFIIFAVINYLLVSILMAIISNVKVWLNLKNQLGFILIGIFFTAPFGMLLVYMYNHFEIGGVLVIFIPMLFIRYTYGLYIDSKSKYHEMVKVLMNALEMRDKYTEGHCRNVAKIVKKIAEELKYSDNRIEELELAAYLHDIGKIGIPDNILNKPDKLTKEEYQIIQQHPVIGYNIVKDIYGIGRIVDLVKYHHERYDGTGYPEGKKGDEIDLDVYILQLADALDAMSTDRIYRRALNEEEIKIELLKNRGKQFHPKLVDIYLKILEKEKKEK